MDGIRFDVTGRVQGVGFRAWTRATAARHDIIGSVRNQPDGGVRIEAAGSASALDAFRAALRQGPPHARITGIAETPVPVTGNAFVILP